ncbi:MAG: zinc ribbon domain-containing protein [Vicinamibacteria bacterium]
MEACPKCGKPVEPRARICAWCGVILAKVRARTDRTATVAPATPRMSGRPLPKLNPTPIAATQLVDDAHVSPKSALIKVVAATAIAVGALLYFNRSGPPVETKALTSPPSIPEPKASPFPTRGPVNNLNPLSPPDATFLNALGEGMQKNPEAVLGDADTIRVEALYRTHTDNENLKGFLIAIHFRRASREMQLASYAKMDESLSRIKELDGEKPDVYAFEAQAKARQDIWDASLAASQKYEALSGDATINMSFTMAVALDRLGRPKDALSVLERPIFDGCQGAARATSVQACDGMRQLRMNLQAKLGGTATAAAEVERQRAQLAVDPAKQQIGSDLFDIRFDGESQNGVARDVLFVLNRAYTRLADTYYVRPNRRIPVVLHSGQSYFTATGAPFWSGGQFSSHTGAIQIPIRGIPSTLPREMEDVLVHELSHAFVDEMSGGFAGSSLQEGLAQYMEGKRIETEMTSAELKALANTGNPNVMSFYMLSLAMAQQMVSSRGQGQINELLKAMKNGGSEDAGFKKIYNQTAEAVRMEILATFWRRYS